MTNGWVDMKNADMVLVMGGNATGGGANDSAEIYDPDSGTWSPTGSMHHAREALRAVKLPDGRVLLSSGARGLFLVDRAAGARAVGPEVPEAHAWEVELLPGAAAAQKSVTTGWS